MRGLMPRQIVRVITPGTVGEETVLVADEKNFLVAIARTRMALESRRSRFRPANLL